jgi:hypothetical protein
MEPYAGFADVYRVGGNGRVRTQFIERPSRDVELKP